MRHEKIIATDDLGLLPSVVCTEEDDFSGEDAEKAPQLAQQHFWYSGRAPSRNKGPVRCHY